MNRDAQPVPAPGDRTKLTYSLMTQPNPPTASHANEPPGLMTLTIVASNSGQDTVACEAVEIFFPVGPDARDLSGSGEGIEVGARPDGSWALTHSEVGHYVFKRPYGKDPSVSAAESYTFVIADIPMSAVVGNAEVTVYERSVTGAGTEVHLTKWKVPKFPAGFDPVTLKVEPHFVQAGEKVTVSWSGDSVGDYWLTINEGTPKNVTGQSPLPPMVLTEDSVFTLRVTCESAEISQEFTQSVIVGLPRVLTFSCEPDPMDNGDEVTLSWTTANTDFTELRIEPQGTPQRFGQAPGPNDGKHRLLPGCTYWLVPFKGALEGEPFHLVHSFNPGELRLTASPSSLVRPLHDGAPTKVTPEVPEVTVAYEAKNVKSFTIDTTTTDLLAAGLATVSGSKTYSTTKRTRYGVSALDLAGDGLHEEVWVDVRQFDVVFRDDTARTTVTFTLEAGEESGVSISNAHLCFSAGSDFLSPQGSRRSEPLAVELVRQGTVWTGQLEFDLPDGSAYMTAGVVFDCQVAGPTGTVFSASQDMIAWREFGGTGTDVVLPADAWTQHPVKARAIAVTQGSSDPWVAFYVDMANAVHWKRASDSGWTPPMEGIAATEVAAMTNPDGRVEVYAIDAEGNIKHNWQSQPNGPFQDAWANVGQGKYTDISVGFVAGSGALVLAISNQVLNLLTPQGTFGVLSSRLARVSAMASPAGYVQALVSNLDLRVYQARNGMPGPYPGGKWETISEYTQARDVAIVQAKYGYSTQYHCGNNPSLYVRREGGQWRRFFNGNVQVPVQAKRLAVATDRNGADVVFIIGPDNALSHTSQSVPGTW